jgi:cyclopropane-fatty-acyl-phospholipid synthase
MESAAEQSSRSENRDRNRRIAADEKQARLEARIQKVLNPTDIRLNGDRPWDVKVNNPELYRRVMRAGTLGLGESYMDGWWDCDALDQMAYKYFRAKLPPLRHNLILVWEVLRAKLLNRQSINRAREVGEKHYDIGNDLFEKMLDPLMNYSCAYWTQAETLEEAQRAKLDLICRKLRLEPGLRVLDIGCGWGGALKYAAENYGVEGVGITISKEQAALAQERVKDLPVEIRIQDYRELEGEFDHIFSIGMFEHVGPKNYRTFMETSRRLLKPEGMLLLHTIGNNTTSGVFDPWMDRYIFPNAHLPSAEMISSAADGLFVLEDWHNFGPDYDKTLMAWNERFQECWPELEKSGKYDERFRRMWQFYLLTCAGSFRARQCQLFQVLLSPHGIPGGMRVPR